MQAIVTTQTENGKILARYGKNALATDWPARHAADTAHGLAALALARKHGLNGIWRGAEMPDGGWCWVYAGLDAKLPLAIWFYHNGELLCSVDEP